MPSFLGRLFGLSFRTELLIMNLVGLVNSTLDWSPLKWTNKLERIWNLSLSQRTLILDTIGEDTIKTVLSWVVITRIVIAHVYTFTYVTNVYPILTWSRPNLLLPWLILSFFKNVVLEVIVIVIGLLIWYETQFSVVVFLEFILVKLVPLILACYNWYSNSCLFLQLRSVEKIRTLRAMRSDSNLVSSRLCAKIEDSKYRARSLTTLFSCESYETYDTQDTISLILEDPHLTPAQKAMKILGLSERDLEETRIRVKEKEEGKRLTAKSSEILPGNDRKNVNLYLLLESEHDIESGMETKDQSLGDDSALSKTVSSPEKDSSVEAPKTEEKYPEQANATERRLSRKKREGTEEFDTKKTKQMKLSPLSHAKDTKACSHLLRRRETTRLCCSRQSKKNVEKSCSPVKLQDLFNCNCLLLDYPFKGTADDCCVIKDTRVRTSTPKKSSDDKEIGEDAEQCPENTRNTIEPAYVYSCSRPNVKNEFTMSDSSPLMETLLRNYPEILKSITMANQNAEKNVLAEDKSVQDVGSSKPEEDESDLRSGIFSNYRNTLIDLQDLSSDPEDSTESTNATMGLDDIKKTKPVENVEAKAESELLKTATASNSPAEDGACSAQKSNLQLYSALDAKKNALKLNLPEYSFCDTSIPKLYENSMKVFDGCYEKDFDNNSELQCLLEQMKKKNWNLFPTQGGIEMFLATTFSKEVDNIIEGIQNLRIEDSTKMDRYEVSVSKSSKSTTAESSEEVQTDEQSQHPVPRKPKGASKPTSSPPPVKDVCTQTFEDFHLRTSFNSLVEARKRKKRRHLKDQSGSTVSVGSKRSVQSINKAESFTSVSKDRSRSPTDYWRRLPSKTSNEETKKQPSLTKSQSDKSVCGCRMQKLEAKYCASSEFRLDRKDDKQKAAGKQKIDNFGTIPLAQVARTTDVDSMVFRRKPPLYPKKNKNENAGQMTVRKTRVNRKPQELESKQSLDKQSYNSKTPKTKSRLKSLGEQEALEMRALKAYNEVTLLKDKRDLESKKKSSGRNSVDQNAENLKSYSQTRKGTLDRFKKDVPKNAQTVNKDHLNKENLVDATTETDSSIVAQAKDIKLPLNVPGARSFSILNDKYPCSKLLSVNRVTERLLDNFDRLHGSQVKQDAKKGKPAAEVDSRKQYTKYSKPKKLVHEENLSVTSSKKLEGTQKGRELERTPAKEDVRNSPVASAGPSVLDQLSRIEPSRDSRSPEARDKELLMTIKSIVNQDIVSNWSSSTVDQVNEVVGPFDVNLNIEEHVQALLGAEESKDQGIKEPDTVALSASPSSESVCVEEKIEIPLGSEENGNQVVEPAQIDPARERRRLDLTDFTRDIDVSCVAHGVVLANTHAQGKSLPRDIVDDRTARLVHNALFYKSTESLLDFPPDVVTMEDVLNDSQLESSVDEFACRPSNDALVFTEEPPLTSRQGSSLEQTLLATIRDANQPEGNCDLCIITIEQEDPSTNPEEEAAEGFSSIEGLQQPSISELQMSDILLSIAEVLRSLNIRGLDLSNFTGEKLESFQNLLYDDEGEPRNEILEIDNIEEQEKVEEKGECSKIDEDTLRFIKEDIFTNIKFPIVIDRSKLIPDVLAVSIDDPQQLSARVEYADLMGTNLLPSIKEKKEENEEVKKIDDTVEQVSADFGQESEILNDTLLDSLDDSDISSVSESFELHLDTSDSKDDDYNNRKTVLNETFEIVKLQTSFEEEIFGEQESIKSEEIAGSEDEVIEVDDVKKETITVVEDTRTEEGVNIEDSKSEGSVDDLKIEGIKTEETVKSNEEMDISIQFDEFTEDEEKRILDSSNEENDDAVEEIKGVEEDPAVDVETKKEIVDLEPKVSLKVIFMFWFIVFFFYMRYFYQKICSFARISRTTSTLKPFEVHTVSTSTSTLLEKTEFAKKITEELPRIEEDDSTEESNTDLEETDESGLDENLRKTVSSTNLSVLPNIVEVGSEDDIEDLIAELEETMLSLSKDASEHSEASLLPTFDAESVIGRYNYVLRNTELTAKEGTSSESPPVDEDPQLQSFLSIDTPTDDDQSNLVDKPKEIVVTELLSTFYLEEEGKLELPKPEKEIETFRFEEVDDSSSTKSLLEDNRQESCEDQVNVTVKVETEAAVFEPEEIQISDTEVTSNFLILQSNEEGSQNESNVRNPTSVNQETSVFEEGGSTEQNVEEIRSPSDRTETVPPTPFEISLTEIDSFTSTYTRQSEMSRNTVSVDLGDSSMEEFSIASNEDA